MCKKNLVTEARNKNTMKIDQVSTAEMLTLLNDENKVVPIAVEKAIPQIVKAVDLIVERYSQGGRIIYIGAGTSGRLGVLDAAECPPTFGVPYDSVIGIIAGGLDAMVQASESVEDSAEAGINDLCAINLSPLDTVIGISASGGPEYAVAGLTYAKTKGAATIAIVSNTETKLAEAADIPIEVITGPEAITGSTRMKAGTAQKMVMNMISTGVMIKTGKVYQNLMINIKPVNDKLLKRSVSIISEITGEDSEIAMVALIQSNHSIRDAIDSLKK